MKTRVVLVDDQELLRAGVRLALERSEDLEVVAEAIDCVSGSDAIVATTPDVLVLDMSLPDGEGLALLETCREHSPATRVLALSSHQSREWADRASRPAAPATSTRRSGSRRSRPPSKRS